MKSLCAEMVFAWPGIGQLTVEAIQRRDYPLLQACVLVIGVAYVTVNTLTDVTYRGAAVLGRMLGIRHGHARRSGPGLG